ncbi:MAG: PH domain-containing protein [Gemmatimonadetes bacterium]|nr:PH domain-containing protein [Gemmatimonadota bacterium]NIQ55461.1 PH domain-containing protein [Gemmatimonadota bacterium]NIU75670.1 PH domain-containing protein [Gammaproteobacteria bacterium]NIX45341.1 PH domain-containing protein [Gemmatimonadota bacterium]NIY09630.1 PH domain-containing protein [Gemmatimonadota bacterium]
MMEVAQAGGAGALELDRLPVVLRPSPALLRYYALASLIAGPFFLFPLVPLYLRYRTLRYRIDDEGISMRWGALFRREVTLNYARIQDIHLSSNVVERWLGLGKIQVQTASGSAKAEMTIEGVPGLEAMRDFLYARMRGARREDRSEPDAPPAGPEEESEIAATLRAVTAELRALREELARKQGGTPAPSDSAPSDRRGEGPGEPDA